MLRLGLSEGVSLRAGHAWRPLSPIVATPIGVHYTFWRRSESPLLMPPVFVLVRVHYNLPAAFLPPPAAGLLESTPLSYYPARRPLEAYA